MLIIEVYNISFNVNYKMIKLENFEEFKYYVKSDLYRYMTSSNIRSFLRAYFIPGFKYTFWLRVCQWCKSTNKTLLFFIARILLRHYSFKYGIIIPYQTSVGRGLYIGHFSCIVINESAIIGKNVNISQGVTIGEKNGGSSAGSPIIGDAVYIAAGAKIVGKCFIGNRVLIGANSVVTKDIEDNSVVVGIPARIISDKGSYDYVGSFFDK